DPHTRTRYTHRPLPCLLACILLYLGAPVTFADKAHRFNIPASSLADALDQFSEQSGLQTVYASVQLSRKNAPAISGELNPEDVLNRLVADTGIVWRYVSTDTVLLERRDDSSTTGSGKPDDSAI